jgi:hypothetical protein
MQMETTDEPFVRSSERRGQRPGWEGERLASRQLFMAPIHAQSLEVPPTHEPPSGKASLPSGSLRKLPC